MATLLPEGKQSFTNSAGAPLVGGKVYTYDAGTSTPRPTYQDAAATVPNTNPVVLDARGEAVIFWSGSYKVVLKDASDVTIWTIDNITDTSSIATSLDAALRADLASSAVGKGTALIGNLISADVTLLVPSQYASITAAMDYLRTKTIVKGATATVQVADGTYVLASSVNLNHPQGDQIKVIGNQVTPANCIITTAGAPTFDGFVLSNGHALQLLDGFRVTLPAKATSANGYTAVLALNGATLVCGSKMQTNNWYYGIAARVGSSIVCDDAVVSNAGDVGIWAFIGSAVQCRRAAVSNCADSTNSLGWGIEAEYGSSIDCESATVTACYRGGIGALSGSTIRAISATANANTGYASGAHGLFSENGSVIEAHNAVTTNNSGFGIHRGSQAMGIVYGNGITNTGNTNGTDNTGLLMDVSGGQARLLAYGPTGMRVDNANAAPIYFNTAGGAQFEVAHAASAVNHPYAQGSAAGSPVVLGATGTDAIIDLYLSPKGAGSYVRVGAGYAAQADAPVIGTISIKDNTGTVRKLAIVA